VQTTIISRCVPRQILLPRCRIIRILKGPLFSHSCWCQWRSHSDITHVARAKVLHTSQISWANMVHRMDPLMSGHGGDHALTGGRTFSCAKNKKKDERQRHASVCLPVPCTE
jgi:hypothetical protein